jgi:hypothetical protein
LVTAWLPLRLQCSLDEASYVKQPVTATESDRPSLARFNAVNRPLAHGPPLREQLCVWQI